MSLSASGSLLLCGSYSSQSAADTKNGLAFDRTGAFVPSVEGTVFSLDIQASVGLFLAMHGCVDRCESHRFVADGLASSDQKLCWLHRERIPGLA